MGGDVGAVKIVGEDQELERGDRERDHHAKGQRGALATLEHAHAAYFAAHRAGDHCIGRKGEGGEQRQATNLIHPDSYTQQVRGTVKSNVSEVFDLKPTRFGSERRFLTQPRAASPTPASRGSPSPLAAHGQEGR